MSDAPSPEREALCPSAPCEPGAILLGVVQRDGTVGYIQPQMRIDEEFVARATPGRSPGTRFRFAQPCVEGRCGYWTGSRCGVADTVVEWKGETDEPLPRCSIRRDCQWFSQSGPSACRVCPLVMTEVRVTGGASNPDRPLPQCEHPTADRT